MFVVPLSCTGELLVQSGFNRSRGGVGSCEGHEHAPSEPGAAPWGHLNGAEGDQCFNFILSAAVGDSSSVTSP